MDLDPTKQILPNRTLNILNTYQIFLKNKLQCLFNPPKPSELTDTKPMFATPTVLNINKLDCSMYES